MDKQEILQLRLDGLSQSEMGMGGLRDKLDKVTANSKDLLATDSRDWYAALGNIQNAIDIPAEDATREWITIKTNREDLGISRLIQNRLVELGFQEKLKDLVRFSRMYSMGGFLYYGIDSSIPQTAVVLDKPFADHNRIAYVNVFGPDRVGVTASNTSPLSIEYHRPTVLIDSVNIHPSRFHWLVLSYLPEKNTGISIIQRILDAAKAQGIALWSITSILSELSIKIFKSPAVNSEDPEKLMELISLIRHAISTQGVFAAGEGEALERLNANTSGIKELLDFILDNLAGLAKIPKSRLSGQAQGTLTGGQYDLISYYDSIAKFQENQLRPILERAISLIVKEKSGEIVKRLGAGLSKLDWEFKFNKLWKLTESEEADVRLKNAQADKIYIESGVLAPSEVRKNRFSDLEEFGGVSAENMDFATSPLPDPNDLQGVTDVSPSPNRKGAA